MRETDFILARIDDFNILLKDAFLVLKLISVKSFFVPQAMEKNNLSNFLNSLKLFFKIILFC